MKSIKSRKAEGLSITVIVIAAVALFVLIILILIFSGKLDVFNRGVSDCPPNSNTDDDVVNGVCVTTEKLPVKVIRDPDDEDKITYCCPINS